MTGVFVFILRILLAISLYAFIGIVFVTVWRQLQAQIKILSPQISNNLRLIPLDAEDTEVIEIKQSEVIVGRDPNNKVYIPDETVSAQHARIYFSDHHWWINDLNSTNGTYLNDELIDRPCVLTENDIIMAGQVKFTVQIINIFMQH
jgi:pSer/pThr/pTyr-binding forkhead associated (FHA) protein